MTVRESVQELVALVEQGKFMEAIEKFYAADATTQENVGPLNIGLDTLLAKEKRAMENYRPIHVHKAKGVVIDGQTAAINWIFEWTNPQGKRIKIEEVAWQEWRDGKIVREQYFYDPAQRSA